MVALGLRALDAGAQLRRELALLVDGLEDGGAALVQLGQVLVAVADVAQLHLVQLARGFLAVAGDERDGVAGQQQLQRGGHLCRAQAELGGDLLGVRRRQRSA
jgi:hypothetical protein